MKIEKSVFKSFKSLTTDIGGPLINLNSAKMVQIDRVNLINIDTTSINCEFGSHLEVDNTYFINGLKSDYFSIFENLEETFIYDASVFTEEIQVNNFPIIKADSSTIKLSKVYMIDPENTHYIDQGRGITTTGTTNIEIEGS